MPIKCLSCGKPLGGSPGLCYSCRKEGVEIEDVVDVDESVVDRVQRYLVLSSVRCPDCGELHERVTVDGETHTTETLGIDSIEEWEAEMDEEEAWLADNRKAVREALPLLEPDWPESTGAVRDILE